MSKPTRISFTVVGNNREPDGNPRPYTRTTQGGKWHTTKQKDGTPNALGRYYGYRDWVMMQMTAEQKATLYDIVWPTLEHKLQFLVDIRIDFKGFRHGDPDNVVKGLLDTLFLYDDNMVVPRLVGVREGQERGQVWITIHGPYPSTEYADVGNMV